MRDEVSLDASVGHRMVPLESVASSIQAGITLGSHRVPRKRGAGYLRVANVRMGWIDDTDVAHVEELPGDRPRYELVPNDVLVVEGHADPGQIGRAALVREEHTGLLYQNHLFRLRFAHAVPEFAVLWLNSTHVRAYWRANCATSSGLYTVNSKLLGQVPFLPLPERAQREIAAVHAAFERRIAALERVRGKLGEAKHAALSERLAGSGRTLLLDDLLEEIQSGWSPACDSYPPGADEWGVVRVSAVTSGRFDPVESKRLPPGLQPRPFLEIAEGDVLMARANGARSLVGAVCYVGPTRQRLMLSDKILRLVPRSASAEPKFLALLLASDGVRGQIGNLLNGGTGQNNITQADVRGLKVPAVSVEEQRSVVAVQASFQRRIEAVEGHIAKLRIVQQGVIEDLLGGRVRVPEVVSAVAA